jgi:lipopolysaccharide transport system ATP-binding protein/teichoic acid transport system ATP-binding protein
VSDRQAITVEDLRVQYRQRLQSRTFADLLSRSGRERTSVRTIEALRGVSFGVQRGEVLGVIGRNGAGKSTLLRAIAGILPPTTGRVTVRGRLSTLLTLGAAFNRQLTGRENIVLGGLASGLDRRTIDAAMEQIADFAELGEFLDYPVRTYSSGMSSRLAFAVAAQLEPEILLIDEALAAGDSKFKEKCAARIDELCGGGHTVVLVSHGLSGIRRLASHCVWLDGGLVMAEGETDEVVDAYMRHCRIERVKRALEDDFDDATDDADVL